MGLHRLYWIPDGSGDGDGAYVPYRHEELRAVVALEASRAGTTVVGEDLGTVPDRVRAAMAHDRMLRSWVFQFETTRRATRCPAAPERSLAAWGTHDLPRFAAYWEGTDIDERRTVGRPRRGDGRRRTGGAEANRAALEVALRLPAAGTAGLAPAVETMDLLRACLGHLAAGRGAARAGRPRGSLGRAPTPEPSGHRARGAQLAAPGGSHPRAGAARRPRGRRAGPGRPGPERTGRGGSPGSAADRLPGGRREPGAGCRQPTGCCRQPALRRRPLPVQRGHAPAPGRQAGRPRAGRAGRWGRQLRGLGAQRLVGGRDRRLQRLGSPRRPARGCGAARASGKGWCRGPGQATSTSSPSRPATGASWRRPIRSPSARETPPRTGSVVWDLAYEWGDDEWMRSRGERAALDAPISIYEVHLGSWRRDPPRNPVGCSATREVAPRLIDHVRSPGVHPRGVPAHDGAPLLRVVGLPGDRVLRADVAATAPHRSSWP